MSSLLFNANEVFDVATQLERNAAAFYRSAAEQMTDESTKKLMSALAEMEVQHEKLFSEMQQTLQGTEIEETLYDPHDEAFSFLKGMAQKYVFNPAEDVRRAVRPGADLVEVLNAALELERDSIIFYEGIKVMVPEKYGRKRVDEIIGQEMGHIMLLTKHLEAVQAQA